MLNLININRPIIVNGVTYQNSNEAYEKLKGFEGEIKIVIPGEENERNHEFSANLFPENDNPIPEEEPTGQMYEVRVAKYMTEYSSPGFEFMEKWNNNVPMPSTTMKGYIVGKGDGMTQMDMREPTRNRRWRGWVLDSAIREMNEIEG